MAFSGVMRFSLLIFAVFSCFLRIDGKDVVPVFMWESSSGVKSPPHSVPALAQMSSNDFQNLLITKIHEKAIVVVFFEENLSIEDFSSRDALGHTAFPDLESLASTSDSMTFIPKVRSPLHGIRSLGKKWKHIPFTAHNWDHEVSHAHDSILLVDLNDARENEDRHHFLKRHDTFMSNVYKKLESKYNKVAAVYTGRHASWFDEASFPSHTRPRRDVNYEGELNSTTFYNGDNRIYIFTHSIPILNDVPLGTPTSVVAVIPTSPSADIIASLIVTYDTAKLTFNFREKPASYWVLDEVIAEVDAETVQLNSSMIQAPYGFSYNCRQHIVFNSTAKLPDGTNDKKYLLFVGMQVEFFREPIEGDLQLRKFNDAYDCTSFFTIGILSGYFVAILFALILGIGICMIMDIKTMDRFDDPKGTTITVSAVE